METTEKLHKTKKCIQDSPEYKSMDNYMDTAIAEGFCEGEDATELQVQAAWQWLHDTGFGYTLQGWFGRTIQDLIVKGVIFN